MSLRDPSDAQTRSENETGDRRRIGHANENLTLPEHEAYRRDHDFKRSCGVTVREGLIWDEAWAAARSYYLAKFGGNEDVRNGA